MTLRLLVMFKGIYVIRNIALYNVTKLELSEYCDFN